MPCSPEIAPPRSIPIWNSSRVTWYRIVGVGLEDREVHVAVARVPAAGDPGAVVRAASSLTLAMNSGIDARGTTTSKMSSALFAFATQNAFSRASMSCAAAVDGST